MTLCKYIHHWPILILLTLGGCANTPPMEPSAEFAPVLLPKYDEENKTFDRCRN